MFTKYIENFLSDDECDFIVSLGETIDLKRITSTYIVGGKITIADTIYAGNKRVGGHFNGEILEIPAIKNLSDKIIKLSNRLTPFKGVVYNSVSSYTFNRYEVGDFLNWHSDGHEILNGATLTYIIQLNDNYEDGHVKYIINNVEHNVIKKKGSVFVFDSNIRHSVEKITSGTRYSINVWPTKIIKKSLI